MHMLRSSLRKAKRKHPEAIVPILQVRVEDPRDLVDVQDNEISFAASACALVGDTTPNCNSDFSGTVIDVWQHV
jgi:hypothetical protein